MPYGGKISRKALGAILFNDQILVSLCRMERFSTEQKKNAVFCIVV